MTAEALCLSANDWALSAIVVLAVGVAAAFVADKYRARALLWLTSIGGASMILDGLGRTADPLDFLRNPDAGWQQIVSPRGSLSALRDGLSSATFFAEKLGIEKTAV